MREWGTVREQEQSNHFSLDDSSVFLRKKRILIHKILKCLS